MALGATVFAVWCYQRQRDEAANTVVFDSQDKKVALNDSTAEALDEED